MKKYLLVISSFIFTISLCVLPVNAKVKHSPYERSTTYKTYSYKNYTVKGKLYDKSSFQYITKGRLKGLWKFVGEQAYESYDFYSDGLYVTYGTENEINSGNVRSERLLPGRIKKGAKGILNDDRSGVTRYKILSTSSTVKTPVKTYKNAIKMWLKNGSYQTIVYYVKYRGCVKEQTLYEGEYKTTSILYKIKK